MSDVHSAADRTLATNLKAGGTGRDFITSKFAHPSPHRPQCAGHRGFKACYAENTILAMREAIRNGATVIETDIQISGDGEVIVTHDPTATRCFGEDLDVTSTPYYGVLDQLRTIDGLNSRDVVISADDSDVDELNLNHVDSQSHQHEDLENIQQDLREDIRAGFHLVGSEHLSKHSDSESDSDDGNSIMSAKSTSSSAATSIRSSKGERMPLFKELVKVFATDPEFENVQLMLDVKRTNQPWALDKVVEILKAENDDLMGFWARKMALGIWRMDVLEHCHEILPGFPVIHIGFSLGLARQFLDFDDQVIGISMKDISLNIIGGQQLIDYARSKNKLVYSWTVNSIEAMKWAVSANLDGVITDNVDLFSQFVDSISEKDIQQVYAKVNPSSFFTWYQSMIEFPLMYVTGQFYLTLYAVISVFFSNKKPSFLP